MTHSQAKRLAEKFGKSYRFEHWEGDESDGFLGSEVGTVDPCGCVHFSTILSDGSLGIGGWMDPCSFEHM